MMTTSGQKSLPVIGFLTITRNREHGLFGGYLLLNAVGRPLEFHCTTPVRPNRAQEILYGPTLDPYLCGERIGATLLDRSKLSPVVVFTDVPPAMAMRPFVPTPVILVLPGSGACDEEQPAVISLSGSSVSAGDTGRLDTAHSSLGHVGQGLHYFHFGGYHLAFSVEYSRDEETVERHWPQLADQIDLEEPFGRIREAIDEACHSARKGVTAVPESHENR